MNVALISVSKNALCFLTDKVCLCWLSCCCLIYAQKQSTAILQIQTWFTHTAIYRTLHRSAKYERYYGNRFSLFSLSFFRIFL